MADDEAEQLRCVLAVIPESRLGRIEVQLRHRQRRFTRLDAQGGFMRRGNAVLMLVSPSAEVEEILGDLRQGGGPAQSPSRGEPEAGTIVFVLPLTRNLSL